MSEDNAIDSNELDAVINEANENEVSSSGESVTNSEPQFSTGEQLQPVLGMAFKVLAPNWNVQAEEVEVLAQSYGECIDYYYPDIQEGLPPWLTPLIVTAAIIGPRVNMPRKDEKEVSGDSEKDGEPKS